MGGISPPPKKKKKSVKQLESTLLTGTINDTVGKYPELDKDKLEIQLAMFKQYKVKTTADAVKILQEMNPETRGLFKDIETLVRLLLVVPVSSAEAERSFSALRRLKTWLRSTMTQKRLNGVAVCHIHQDRLDKLDRKDIAQQFVQGNDRRRLLFGSYMEPTPGQ